MLTSDEFLGYCYICSQEFMGSFPCAISLSILLFSVGGPTFRTTIWIKMCSKTKGYSFISEPDVSFLCCICLELASQPKQCEDCGMLFCTKCIEKTRRKLCPNCRTVNPRYFKDVKSKLTLTFYVYSGVTKICTFFQAGERLVHYK